MVMQNQQTCSCLNDDSNNEGENDAIQLSLVLCALLALAPLTGVCACSSDPCPALPGPANLLEQRAGLLHGAGVTCLSYRISRSRSGCSQLQENIAQRRGVGVGVGWGCF